MNLFNKISSKIIFILCFIFVFLMLFLNTDCFDFKTTANNQIEKSINQVNSLNNNDSNKQTNSVVKLENEMRGIWFSYLDWMNLVDVSTENEQINITKFKNTIEQICNNLVSIGVNNLFLHVRAFGDAFYPSKIAHKSKFLKNLNFDEFDPLKEFITVAKNHNIKVHGWINPMRTFSNKDQEYIPNHFKIKQWFLEPNQKNYYAGLNSQNCWVLNPCNGEVVNLIIDVVDELLSAYDLDGLHIDDYFFPSNISQTNFDAALFEQLKPNCDINKFRFLGVSNLVKLMHKKCHEKKPNCVFGAAIIGNFKVNETLFADINDWLKNGYVDYLMPEIYYSFQNKKMPFDKCVFQWNDKINEFKTSINFYVGLAAYRIGEKEQSSDLAWSTPNCILKDQELFCRNNLKNYCGYCLFDYKSIFEKNGARKQRTFDEINSLNSLFKK